MQYQRDKYTESIQLTYEHVVRMLLHLRNIRDKYNSITSPDDIDAFEHLLEHISIYLREN